MKQNWLGKMTEGKMGKKAICELVYQVKFNYMHIGTTHMAIYTVQSDSFSYGYN